MIADVFQFLLNAGGWAVAAILLGFFLYLFAKGEIVPANQLNEMTKDRDFWRDIGMKAAGVAQKGNEATDRAVSILHKVVNHGKPEAD